MSKILKDKLASIREVERDFQRKPTEAGAKEMLRLWLEYLDLVHKDNTIEALGIMATGKARFIYEAIEFFTDWKPLKGVCPPGMFPEGVILALPGGTRDLIDLLTPEIENQFMESTHGSNIMNSVFYVTVHLEVERVNCAHCTKINSMCGRGVTSCTGWNVAAYQKRVRNVAKGREIYTRWADAKHS